MRIPIKSIGQFCKMYRTYVLDLTLKEMSDLTGVKIPTLSSFENGRSANIKHVKLYYEVSDKEQKEFFRNNIPLEMGDDIEN